MSACTHVCVTLHAWYPRECSIPWNIVTDDGELPCRRWETNSGPLEKQRWLPSHLSSHHPTSLAEVLFQPYFLWNQGHGYYHYSKRHCTKQGWRWCWRVLVFRLIVWYCCYHSDIKKNISKGVKFPKFKVLSIFIARSFGVCAASLTKGFLISLCTRIMLWESSQHVIQ